MRSSRHDGTNAATKPCSSIWECKEATHQLALNTSEPAPSRVPRQLPHTLRLCARRPRRKREDKKLCVELLLKTLQYSALQILQSLAASVSCSRLRPSAARDANDNLQNVGLRVHTGRKAENGHPLVMPKWRENSTEPPPSSRSRRAACRAGSGSSPASRLGYMSGHLGLKDVVGSRFPKLITYVSRTSTSTSTFVSTSLVTRAYELQKGSAALSKAQVGCC